ncbi:uncharacterized protein BX664DRAFT_246983, partial [Halteromyces radiatus]|uniref:uncharacterized protein n=1 Tax=Halteromyces radiatus TaxID=101107 RepID=UPI0022202477
GRITCRPGKVCIEEKCVDPPTCAGHGQQCRQKGCCDGLYCHQRTSFGAATPICVQNAFTGEDCSSGIPCEGTSQCIRGRCSVQGGSDCDFDGAVCPYGFLCGHVNVFEHGTNKMCL